ncbi:hypothetical protein AAHA92_09619 [Salvia divinorum]|uniref:Uncharacterized protein n=1 Tax=Salvia divinorum TaxID=28513 RepID=A0ABD1HS03_SALDI
MFDQLQRRRHAALIAIGYTPSTSFLSPLSSPSSLFQIAEVSHDSTTSSHVNPYSLLHPLFFSFFDFSFAFHPGLPLPPSLVLKILPKFFLLTKVLNV